MCEVKVEKVSGRTVVSFLGRGLDFYAFVALSSLSGTLNDCNPSLVFKQKPPNFET